MVPKGRAYHKILEMIDLDFGMNFAERAIGSTNIDVKGVRFIQRNKKRGVTDYKENSTEFAQASESYFSIGGKPDFEAGYGKKIDCGNAVSIGKTFPLKGLQSEKRKESIENFVQLSFDIEETLQKDPHGKFPRAVRVKNQKEIDDLDDHILTAIKTSNTELNLSVDTNRIQMFDNNIMVVNNDFKMIIYIVNQKENTSKEIELNDSSIIEYIREYKDSITSNENLRFQIIFNDSDVTPITKPFKHVVHCEMEFNETVYLLENGSWQYLNEAFIDLVNNKLDELIDFVDYDDVLDEIHQNSSENNEDKFIEEACTNYDFVKLHRRLINKNTIKAEVADLYSADTDELFAIKRTTDTAQSIYSLSQSNLGIQALKQPTTFSVKDELLKYNNPDEFKEKYPIIPEDMVEKIIKCRNYNVLWLIEEDDPNYVRTGVRNRDFKLSQFGSLLLKLQIIDFYDFSMSNEFSSKIYFSYVS